MKIEVCREFGQLCMTIEDGERLHARVHGPLRDGEEVELDFAGVRVVAAPFLNYAIGALHADFPAEVLATRLRLSNLSEVGAQVARRVMENSEKYYGGSPAYRAAAEPIVNMTPEELTAREGKEDGVDGGGEGEEER